MPREPCNFLRSKPSSFFTRLKEQPNFMIRDFEVGTLLIGQALLLLGLTIEFVDVV